MIVLGLNTGDHDASACLVRDGTLGNYVDEERLSRRTHAVGLLPERALKFCLEDAGLTIADVDRIAVPWVDSADLRSRRPGPDGRVIFDVRDRVPLDQCPRVLALLDRIGVGSRPAPLISCVSHHLAHASAAYRCSGYEEAAVLVVDGWGDRVSTTISVGRGADITLARAAPLGESLGYFYAAVTHFLGLGQQGEGKTMGLAAYGATYPCFARELRVTDGALRVDIGLSGDLWDVEKNGPDEVFAAWMRRIEAAAAALPPEPPADDGRPPADLAASAQAALEDAVSQLASDALREAGSSCLALGGGVALNCSANGKLRRLENVASLFVQPIAHDGGNAIGAALEVAAREGDPPVTPLVSTSLGPHYASDQVAAALQRSGLRYRELDDIPAAAASRVSEGGVVGWFQGRVEGGPRALGCRSIVADPRTTESRDRVNSVKRRERWRPIAPALLAQDASTFLQDGRPSPFMIVADHVRPEMRPLAPAVVHVDGTARPQTVDTVSNPLFAGLVHAFGSVSGAPCVINTSFNDEREPIVCTPQDAIRVFLGTDMDAMVIENFEVRKDSK